METNIYSQQGKVIDNIKLPDSLFSVAWNPDLVHEVIVGMQSNDRSGTAHTKDRSEVRGGGKKPWRQKGTGRARHGSRRSPIWVGGGVTFGPRSDKKYATKINKKTKTKALSVTLSRKFADNEIIFTEKFQFSEPKTSNAKSSITNIANAVKIDDLLTKKRNSSLLILPKRDLNFEKSFANFSNIKVIQAKDVNVLDLLTYKYILLVDTLETIEVLKGRITARLN